MSNLVIDTISYTPAGALNASISGGTGPYFYSINNGPQKSVTSFFYNGTYFNYINETGLGVGNYNVVFIDSSNPQQTAQSSFSISVMYAYGSCLYTGAGNLQGNIHVEYDTSAIAFVVINGPGGPQDSRNLALQNPGLAIFPFLANGSYHVVGYTSNSVLVEDDYVDISCGNSVNLAITSVTTTDASKPTVADGSATGAIVYGVLYGANIVVQTSLDKIVWTNATPGTVSNYSALYNSLKPGTYTMYARVFNTTTNLAYADSAQYTFTVSYTKVYGCTNPNATNYNVNATDDDGSCVLPPLVPKAHIIIPMMNSFRFIDMNLSTQPPTMDNRLYCAEKWQGIARPPYYQKVIRDDKITTQFQSNYTNHLVTMRRYNGGGVVASFPVYKKKQNIGIQTQYPAFLTAHSVDVTKSRLYFNSGSLPLAFVSGDRVEVLNALPATINKEYTITGIGYDATQSVPFIIINFPYITTAPVPARINISAQTQYDILPYDVFETTTDWGIIDNGVYYLQIEVSDSTQSYQYIAAPNPANNIATPVYITQWYFADGAAVASGSAIGQVSQGGILADILAPASGIFSLTNPASPTNPKVVGSNIGEIRVTTPGRTGFDDVLFKSEPFSLFPEQPGTNLINWRNFDDKDGLLFSTGLQCGLRVECEFWQRFPGGTRKTYRGPDARLIKLNATPQRKLKLNTFWLPPWLHEKLAIAFDYDNVEVNGEEFQSEDGYAEPSYVNRYALSNSSIMLEKVSSVDTNSDDIGDVNGVVPFIVINEKFMQI